MFRPTPATLSATAAIALASPLLAATGEEIVATVCAACHAKDAEGRYSRIDFSRRTPEGWEMNVVRMVRNYGLNLGDDDLVAVVRHLADTRGLSVKETEGYRYILEQEPNADDAGPDQLMTDTCRRCHSYARVALQRRTPEDWEKLLHFHLGQFPSLEYQALARDRDWWAVANGDVLNTLTERYVHGAAPAKSDADLSGSWRIAGRQPGRGDYQGTLTVTRQGDDYAVTQELTFADSGTETHEGTAILYGAGEWRASMTAGGTPLREVMALRPDGTMDGRWFHRDQSTLGGRILAVTEDAGPRILSVSPDHIRAGETAEVRIAGVGLSGAPVLPEGLSAEVVSQDATSAVLRLTAAAEAAPARGVRLVAAAPARGGPCFPAAYPGMVAATGDARCGWDEVSLLPGGAIGAWCASPERGDAAMGGAGMGGASIAAARVAGHLAAAFPDIGRDPQAWLAARARHIGAERRQAEPA